MDKQALIAWVEARLAERSTWLGLIGVLGDFGVHLAPTATNWIVASGVAIVSAIMIFTKDHNAQEAISTVVADLADGLKEGEAAQPVTKPAEPAK